MLRIICPPHIVDRPKPSEEYVPLKEVSIESTVRSFAADVTIKQVFRNDEKTPIEAVYCFPIEEQAAIYAFRARIDDREIVADLKEKKEAQKQYTEAIQQGHGAYLLEQDEKSQDNFIINVGALPAGKECHIEISYVTELDLIENGRKIRFVVPTTIAPRYNPDQGGISSPAGTNAKYVQKTSYTVKFHCQVAKDNVSGVSSSSHPIEIGMNDENVYSIQFGQNTTHLDRDIILDIELKQHRSNTILAVESGAVMAAFTPTIEDCQQTVKSNETTNEFVFVVDCSGSMQDENKIGFARQSMLLFLKSLPVQCQFNIIRFGSSYKALFDDVTVSYDENTLRKAEELCKNMQADLGGTELLKPLTWLNEHPPRDGRSRQIFLLTDGEVSNVDEVINLCRSMSTSSRIFSFGLGRSPSRSLVKGLARATQGRFVFIPPDKSVDVYVGEQLEKALQPSITNIHVQWKLNRTFVNAPTKPSPVYANDRLIVYALSDDNNDQSMIFDHQSQVELFHNDTKLGQSTIQQVPHVSNDQTIARLAAKALILELQHSKLPSTQKSTGSLQTRFAQQPQPVTSSTDEKDRNKQRIIELSLKYKILSPHTAFVAIEKRANGDNSEMQLREIPIQISADDQHLQQVHRPMPMAFSCAAPMSFGAMNNASFPTSRARKMAAGPSPPMAAMDVLCSARAMPVLQREMLFCDAMDAECDFNMPKSTQPESFPTDDQNIVRYLIDKQKFDGLWDLDTDIIQKLTGKPLSHFVQTVDAKVLVSALVIVILETRFGSYSSMWHGIVQKSRKRLVNILNNDEKKLTELLDKLRTQI